MELKRVVRQATYWEIEDFIKNNILDSVVFTEAPKEIEFGDKSIHVTSSLFIANIEDFKYDEIKKEVIFTKYDS